MTTGTVDYVSAVRGEDPRIDTVKPEWRDIVAALMFAQVPFEQAVAKFQGIIDQTKQETATERITVQRKREATELEFSKNVAELLNTAALAIAETDRPYMWRILVDYDTPLKNADGSPQMDENNNPMRGPGVEVKATWTKKTESDSQSSVSDGRGRVNYVLLGADKYDSLKQLAEKLNISTDGNVRANLGAHGYTVGDKQTDSENKSFRAVTRAAANNQAAA